MIFTKGTTDDSAILYGMVSKARCGRLSAVYMKVANFLDWIKRNMKKGKVLNENFDPLRFMKHFLTALTSMNIPKYQKNKT